MIPGINELETLTKHISHECKFKFDGRFVIQIKSGITINIDMNVKNIIHVEKIIFAILLHVVPKMLKIFSKYYGWFSDYVW